MQQLPDFNNYLAHIMAHCVAETSETRQRAGLMLKNQCAEQWPALDVRVRDFVKEATLAAIADDHPFIRQTVGTVCCACFLFVRGLTALVGG